MTTLGDLALGFRGAGTQEGGSGNSQKSQISQIQAPANPQLLFPSMHTLCRLKGIEDKSRYSGKMTTHFDSDVGVFGQQTVLIGRGSQFEVRRIALCCDRGYYVQKSMLYAFKKSKLDIQSQSKLVRAVFLEYRSLTHPPICQHPNVVDLLDLSWEADPDEWKTSVKWPVLILEYADRGTLKDCIADSKLSLRTKVKLCLDVAKGLGILHECGIVHGDLKLENVLIFTNSKTGVADHSQLTAKLGDFGVSAAEVDGKMTPSYTEPWNAPEYRELLDHEGLQRTDIYSFGLLVWAVMLDGKCPFDELQLRPEISSLHLSAEQLKKLDDGKTLIRLGRDIFTQVFVNLDPPATVIDATVQLVPERRNLSTARASLEAFLSSQGVVCSEDQDTNATSTWKLDSHMHSIAISSHELKLLNSPLQSYLTTWIESPEANSPEEQGLRYLLAELELDKWLQGLQATPAHALSHYHKIKSPGPSFVPVVMHRLASLAGLSLPQDIEAEFRSNLTKAFNRYFTPAVLDMREMFPEWFTQYYSVSLVQSGAGTTGPLNDHTVRTLLECQHLHVLEALSRAFPNMEIDLCRTALEESSGNLAVHILSQVGSSTLLEKLLLLPNIDIDSRNNKCHETPLLVACRCGRFDTAMLLIEAGADVSLENSFHENPFHWIHSFRFDAEKMTEVAEALLQKGSADLLSRKADKRPSHDFLEFDLVEGTPIVRAIVKGCGEAARLLWQLERRSSGSWTTNHEAIRLAAEVHNDDLLDFFLESPDDLVYPDTGTSILAEALGYGTLLKNGVARILRHGKRCKDSGIATLRILDKYGVRDHFPEIPGLPGCNVLSVACDTSHPEVVEFLLRELGCETYIDNYAPPPGIAQTFCQKGTVMYGLENWKSPPLYKALISDSSCTFKLLLDYGADANAVVRTENGSLTILHTCVTASHDPTYVKMLLDTGRVEAIDQSPENFESPFSTAVRMRKFDMARCLLENGADVNHCSINGCSSYAHGETQKRTVLGNVLRQARSSLSSLACVRFLLETGRADRYTTPEKDETVLHCLAPCTESAMLVREAFRSLNNHFQFAADEINFRHPGDAGMTALELAVMASNVALVDELLIAGAKWDAADGASDSEDSAVKLALKLLYHFPRGVTVEGTSSAKEKQYQDVFNRRRHIALLLARKARDDCAS